MAIWLVWAVQAAPAIDTARASRPLTMTVIPRCDGREASGDIVVCGRKDRYRLPVLPDAVSSERASHDAPSGMAALTPAGRCGIFAGERRCGRREAAEHGYGNGRDPVTVLGRVAGQLLDPD